MGLKPATFEGKTPDWRFWLRMPKVMLWQACALSLEIDPDSMKHSRDGWMARGSGGPSFEAGTFPNEAEKVEFYKRLRLLTANFHDRSHFSPEKLNMAESHLCEVRLPEFTAWALSVGLERIPAKLVDIARAPEAIQPEKKPEATAKPIQDRERDNLHRIIGSLYDFISGHWPEKGKHPNFKSQAQLIEFIQDKYQGMGGLSKRNLQEVLAKAKRLLDE